MKRQPHKARRQVAWLLGSMLAVTVTLGVALRSADAAARRRWDAALAILGQPELEEGIYVMEGWTSHDHGVFRIDSYRMQAFACPGPPSTVYVIAPRIGPPVLVIYQVRTLFSTHTFAKADFKGWPDREWVDALRTAFEHEGVALEVEQ